MYTPRAGAGAGRNYGKKFIRTEFAAYLDDDDYFTKGYLKELASYVTDDVTMVCGGNIDITQDGQWQENPFFTRTLQQYGGKIYDEPWVASMYPAGPCMKIFRTTQPLDVLDFHNFLARSYLILTDSGGIQEEAPSLGKLVLVMRDTTERPEGIAAGTLKLVGTDEEVIYRSFKELLEDPEAYAAMSNASNPYGDGFACQWIADILERE